MIASYFLSIPLFYENIILTYALFHLRPLFQEHDEGVKQGLGV